MPSVIPNVIFVAIFFSGSLLPSSSNVISPRIYGGHNAVREEIPYIVSIENENHHLCGGSILNQQWIVTVAHCVANKTDLKVYAGFFHLKRRNDAQVAEVQEVVVHPDYDYSLDTIDNDVALLRLATNLTFNNVVEPIKIIDEDELSDAIKNSMYGTISGWGHSENYFRSNILRTAEVVLLSDEGCLNDIPPDCHAFNPEKHLCSGGSQAGVDMHDDGGPLVINKKLAGIILHREHGDSVETCHQSSIYARISYYTDFFSANNIFPKPSPTPTSDLESCLLEIEITLELLHETKDDYLSFIGKSYQLNYSLWFFGSRYVEAHDIESIEIYEETQYSDEYTDASNSEYYRIHTGGETYEETLQSEEYTDALNSEYYHIYTGGETYEETLHSEEYTDALNSEYYHIYTGERGEILPLNYEENQEESETKLRIDSEDDDELLLVNSGRSILNIQVWSSPRNAKGSIGFRVFPNSPIDSFILISATTE